jgi:hypothetical protein
MALKSEKLHIRVTREMKSTLKSEAKRDKRKLSSFCEILLSMGLLEHTKQLAEQRREAEQVTA